MDGIDLSLWVGKPPEKANTPENPRFPAEGGIEVLVQKPVGAEEVEVEESEDDTSFAPDEQAGLSHSGESSGGDIVHENGSTNTKSHGGPALRFDTTPTEEDGTEVDNDGDPPSLGLFQKHFYIDVPRLSEEEKQTYEYLPGHFTVERVLSQRKDKRYVVRLESGERDVVSALSLEPLSYTPGHVLRLLSHLRHGFFCLLFLTLLSFLSLLSSLSPTTSSRRHLCPRCFLFSWSPLIDL
jgi:hypothetical protein